LRTALASSPTCKWRTCIELQHQLSVLCTARSADASTPARRPRDHSDCSLLSPNGKLHSAAGRAPKFSSAARPFLVRQFDRLAHSPLTDSGRNHSRGFFATHAAPDHEPAGGLFPDRNLERSAKGDRAGQAQVAMSDRPERDPRSGRTHGAAPAAQSALSLKITKASCRPI
jgi:hypothetical protein